ncbi:hypothetical protein ALC60_06395 [Trachymyrmex zeteki]|uniref:Uncharacterized protein n=1 Tax=Mycetomoellerius zeteki TaxID=64791 RepID=A0A151X334_9HYME|nr:hypothetical protein ALC60_06395 [Trachymyrmex zeteki]
MSREGGEQFLKGKKICFFSKAIRMNRYSKPDRGRLFNRDFRKRSRFCGLLATEVTEIPTRRGADSRSTALVRLPRPLKLEFSITSPLGHLNQAPRGMMAASSVISSTVAARRSSSFNSFGMGP